MVYLLAGNSYHLINDELIKIFKTLDDVEKIDYNETNINEIVNLASYISLFNDNKKILVKNFDINKDMTILENYIEKPNPLTTLVFISDKKQDERKKIIKLLKDNYIYIKPLNYKDISQKLIDLAKKNNYKLSLSNANYITYTSLNNYDLAYNNLEKVFLYYNKPCEIEKKDLENLISSNLEDNNFKFVDAVINRDIPKAINLIKDFKLFKTEPIILINLLSKEYRNLLLTKELINNNLNIKDISKELSLQDWQVEKLINNSYNYSVKELENKLLDILNLDYEIKSGQIDKYLGLEMFILKG